MLIVLTSEQPLENEAEKLNILFEKGLKVLHLRKPTFDIDEYRTLLDKIESKYYNRIMIHQYHELCKEFALRGVHLQEQPRWDLKEQLEHYVQSYLEKGYQVSSSFHSKEEIEKCNVTFEYVLLSPVFGSISKAGYQGKGFDVSDLNEKVIGMGGINEHTISEAFKLGYRGVGVLGGVWNTTSFEDSFSGLLKSYNAVEQ